MEAALADFRANELGVEEEDVDFEMGNGEYHTHSSSLL